MQVQEGTGFPGSASQGGVRTTSRAFLLRGLKSGTVGWHEMSWLAGLGTQFMLVCVLCWASLQSVRYNAEVGSC